MLVEGWEVGITFEGGRTGERERERERERGNFSIILLLVVQIIILKRLSSQQIRFDWYDQFCGGATDGETCWCVV